MSRQISIPLVEITGDCRVSLAPGVQLLDGRLLDSGRNVHIDVDPVGAQAISLLQSGRRLADIAAEIAQQYGVARERVMADLSELIAHGDEFALFRIRRPLLRAAYLRLLRLELFCPSPARRYRHDLAGIVGGAFAVSWWAYPIAVIGTLILVVASIQGSLTLPCAAPWQNGAWLCGPTLAVFLTTVLLMAHEIGHYVALRLFGVPVYYVFRRALTLGIVHANRDGPHLVIAVVAGPALALVVAAVIILVLRLAHMPSYLNVAVAGIACLHLFTLSPMCADGRNLWRHRRSGQQRRCANTASERVEAHVGA